MLTNSDPPFSLNTLIMTLSQLQIFAAITRHGGIRAAARELSMTQSGVTQQLQKLEASIGVPLFTRTNRGVVPTDAGTRLTMRAGVIVAELERAQAEMRQMRGEFDGTIVLGMSAETLIVAFAQVLGDFHQRYPRVQVHLMTGTSRAMIGWIRDGTLDFACALVSSATDVAGLSLTPLFRSEVVVVCRTGHPLQHAGSVRELAETQWIGTRQPNLKSAPTSRLTDLFTQAGLGLPEVVASTESLFDSLHLVANTDYLALEPRAVITHPFFKHALSRIAIKETADSGEICLVQRGGSELTPVVQEFSSMLVSYTRLTKQATQS